MERYHTGFFSARQQVGSTPLSILWTAGPIIRVKFQHFLVRDMLTLTRKETDYTPKELQELVYPGRSQGSTAGMEFQGGRGITLKKEELFVIGFGTLGRTLGKGGHSLFGWLLEAWRK